MTVRLRWTDPNYGESEQKIYRDTQTIDPLNPPAAIATVAADVEEYDDTTALDDVIYYYRISALWNGDEKFSDEITVDTGAFDPSQLFANGETGYWFDFSDLSTMFQDSSGTTPVTADGDLVGYVIDKSGNGYHVSQSTTSKRPTYRTDGVLHWLDFEHGASNGDACLVRADASGLARNVDHGIIGVGVLDTHMDGGSSQHLISVPTASSSASTRNLLRFDDNNNIQMGGRRTDGNSFQSIINNSVTSQEDLIITGVYDYGNATLSLRKNGVEIEVLDPFQSAGSTSDTDPVGIGIGANSDGGSAGRQKITQVITTYGNSDNENKLSQLEGFLLAKNGQ